MDDAAFGYSLHKLETSSNRFSNPSTLSQYHKTPTLHRVEVLETDAPRVGRIQNHKLGSYTKGTGDECDFGTVWKSFTSELI
jgi:hypothetical protein